MNMNDEFWKQKEKDLLERFTEPTYVEYKIVSTTEEGVADLKISNDHNIFDYLSVGMVCIFKELTGCTDKTIYVKHKIYPDDSESGIQVFTNTGVSYMQPNALSDLLTLDVSKYVLHKCFKEDKLYCIDAAMPDFFLYTDVTTMYMGLLKFEGIDLKFDKFEDTKAAQKKVFNILKTLLISHWLGALQEFYRD